MRIINFNRTNILMMIVVGFNITVSGCGGESKWFRDRSNDYKKVESCPTIQIPHDVKADVFSSEYQIP